MISFQCCTVPSSSSSSSYSSLHSKFNFKFKFRPPPLPHLPNPKWVVSSLPSPLRATKRNFLFLLLSLPLSPLPALSESTDGGDPFDPVTDFERQASADVSKRVDKAVELLDLARDFQAKGDFPQALQFFTQLIRDYKDFALSEYARVGRALILYEIGDRDEAIAEMEDVSISLKGYPEIHAALAAALYADKRAPLLAENQFTIATLLDPHYTDISYVRETKHWPPSLLWGYGLGDLDWRANSKFEESSLAMSLVDYVWKHWNAEAALAVVDPYMSNEYQREEVMKCIQEVLVMLHNNRDSLLVPSNPGYLSQHRIVPLKSITDVNEALISEETP